MPQPTTPAPAAPQGSAPASGGSTFREQAMRRLASERGEAPAQPARTSAPQPQPPARPAPRAPEPAQDLAAEPNPVPIADDQHTEPTDAPDGSQELLEGDAQQELDPGDELGQVQAELERLQAREKELTGDYTRKTMRLAEKGRQLESDGQVVRQTAQMLANLIDGPAQQMANIPWAQLQTQKPEEYQRARAQYEQVVTARNNVLQLIAQMEQQQDQAVEQHRMHVAEESREILKARIQGWSNNHYMALREMAVNEYGYSQDEIDRTIDHRFIELLHAVHQTRAARDKLTSIARQPPQQRPQGANRQTVRNPQGQFQSARQHAMNNPGDRQAFRNMLTAKLAAERK